MQTEEKLADDLPLAESNLGTVLALIHHVLPQLDQSAQAHNVQALLRKAAVFIEAARAAHANDMGIAVAGETQTTVESEIVAVIAAAVAVLFDKPFKLVSVQPAVMTGQQINVWAMEGRSQIFLSHKVR
jgi:hypothetical protein